MRTIKTVIVMLALFIQTSICYGAQKDTFPVQQNMTGDMVTYSQKISNNKRLIATYNPQLHKITAGIIHGNRIWPQDDVYNVFKELQNRWEQQKEG